MGDSGGRGPVRWTEPVKVRSVRLDTLRERVGDNADVLFQMDMDSPRGPLMVHQALAYVKAHDERREDREGAEAAAGRDAA
jgi:hypothetical protein